MKLLKPYTGVLILSGVLGVLATAISFVFHRPAGFVALAFSVATLAAELIWLKVVAERAQTRMDHVFGENAAAASRIMRGLNVPLLLCDVSGKIVWRNDAFAALYDGIFLKAILPQFSATRPQTVLQHVYAGSSYQVMTLPIIRDRSAGKQLFFQYWLDRTEAAHYQRLYNEQRPYVMLIYVDNLDELTSDAQFHHTSVLAEVEKLISALCKRADGMYRRYENGRFLCVLEARQLEQIEREKFALLDAAHKIDTGTGSPVSLSLAVGVAPRVAQSEESARQAMELALGRGGDQVVVKDGVDYRFYGGRQQHEAKQSRVKARLFAKALHQLFENAGDVIIMGHRHADMDCLGAALGVLTCANHVGSRAFIVLEEPNPMISDALRHMEEKGIQAIVSPEYARSILKPTSVLVIVDTQRENTTAAPQLLPAVERIVLIDHHRRSADYIENATLHYLESRASSTSEMLAEVLQYFDENVRPSAFVCSALLAGLTVDTKQFAFNVGSRTFEAAGYLRRNGADLTMVKKMFQNDMESFANCAAVVERAVIDEHGIAVSVCPKSVPNSKLTAAQAADELLGIRNVRAAFVLGEDDESVAVSGRSYGRINVQIILEKLGGGGHLTMAGAQLTNVSMETAKEQLLACIRTYEHQLTD